nr:tryptophan 7-halogenase [Sphingomonas jejuensis]
MPSIVILGGGSAGWMVAAALSRFLPAQRRITLIESDEIGAVGVGEATIPQIRLFNQHLGIDENAFLKATAGTFKLGIEFVGWGAPHDRYIHAFGQIGRSLGLLPFHHYWLRARARGVADDLWDHSASAVAARSGRFAPDPGRPGLPSGLAWAYQFDASLYARLLRQHAEANGVTRIEGRMTHATRDPDSGDIQSLALDGGRSVAGDLFIDCTGFRALLIGDTLAAPFDDWSRHLPCDRALAVPTASVGAPDPFTRATARAAGWQWRIPLQHRTGNGLVYSSAFMDDDEAASTLLANVEGRPLADPRPIRFTTGKRRAQWTRNCVAIGLSAGFLEPLESTSIHLIQSAISRLLALMPAGRAQDDEAAEFNRQADAEWQSVRDFLILHYHLNGRDEPFWRDRRAAAIPDSLSRRIALFRSSGRLFREGDELFTEVGWLQVMLGQGVVPQGFNPLAGEPSDQALSEFLKLTRHHAGAVARAMPTHADYLHRHCATDQRKAS